MYNSSLNLKITRYGIPHSHSSTQFRKFIKMDIKLFGRRVVACPTEQEADEYIEEKVK